MRKYLLVKTKKETRKVYLDEIIFIEKDLRRAIVITDDKEIVFYSDMEKIKQDVDERFLDCHRSYLFNMDKIVCMTNQTVYMEQGHQVPLGRESFRRGRRIFNQHLAKEKI